MSKMGIQDTIYEIIKFSRQAGLRHISKELIFNELKNTPLGENDIPNYSGVKSKLQTQVDQALYQLHTSGRIEKKGKGKYTVNIKQKKYYPKICKHIQKKKDDRWYCPIRNCYIGNPKLQCEVLHGTVPEGDTYVKSVIPMCPGYTNMKPTAKSVKHSKALIKMRDDKEDIARRRATPNSHDPVSKAYMPKLHEED